MQQIIDAVVNKKCVLFAGAGVSRDAGLPDWLGLGHRLQEELTKGGKLSAEYLEGLGFLAKDREKVPVAIELMLNEVSRNDVVQALRTILEPSRKSSVCAMIKELGLREVVTTNYDHVFDSLLPGVFRATNSLEKLKQMSTAVGSGRGFLLKLHGDIDDGLDPSDPLVGQGAPFMVLCKGDYAALVQGARRDALILALHSILQERSILFLGYSFSDPDITWMLRFLTENCQFLHPSWYIGLKGERLPPLPNNVTPISTLNTWDDLSPWLHQLSQEAAKLRRAKEKRKEEVHVAEVLSDEKRRAFVAVSQYLTDLASTNLAERVLACALLEDISNEGEFSAEWLAQRVARFTEVGPAWARALAGATAQYLKEIKLIESLPDGRMRAVKSAVETLRARASTECQRDRDKFYESIAKRLGVAGVSIPAQFVTRLEAVLQDLCVNFGQGMAEWVHRGIGRELGWHHAKALVASHFRDREEMRKANAVLDLVFDQPSAEEIPYLYRLLGAAFLANSARLDPTASGAVKTALSSYELFLDSNILLPLVIEEHDGHHSMKAIIDQSRDAGVKLFVIQEMFNEICGHRDLANKYAEECEWDLSRLSELAEVFGKRANCFLRGYLNSLNSQEFRENHGNAATASVTWREYQERYADVKLRLRLERLSLSLVPPDEEATHDTDYHEVLDAITQEWSRRPSGLDRPPVLNENEARQFVRIYRRRAELSRFGVTPQVWFLSYETVLANVFERKANKWGTPPTFPFSAWVAFLDSRLPGGSRDPGAIVNAILKGHSSAIALPEPIALVRKRAFGDRVPTKDEEDAVKLALSGFQLVKKFEQARGAVLARGRLRAVTEESKKATRAVVGEVSSALQETIVALRESLAKVTAELREAKQQQNVPVPGDAKPHGGGPQKVMRRRTGRHRR